MLMFFETRLRVLLVCTVSGFGAALFWFMMPVASRAAPPRKATHTQVDIDPQTMELLARTSAYLQSLSAFTVDAEVTQDEIADEDFKLQRTSTVRVSVRRPDRMRAEIAGDQGERLFTYDGATLGVYLKSQNYYGALAAPSTLRETLDQVIEQHGIEMPLLDVIYVAMGGEIQDSLRVAGTIGPSIIDGFACTQMAFRSDRVDWQLWVEQGSTPLPRKLVITTTDAPTRPQYSAVMRWDLSSSVSEDRFSFQPPPGTFPIALGAVSKPPFKAGKSVPK
jgi:hypothetical protein